MTISGVVVDVNAQRGFFSVMVSNHGFVVMELLGDDPPSVGDVVTGITEDHGEQAVRNETLGDQLRVYVQALGAAPDNARAIVFPQ
jgi:hypothetical protein